MYKLENEKIALTLSDEGAIIGLKNKVTGHEYITYPGGDLWRLFLYEGEPGKPKVGTMPYCWEIPVYSRDQQKLRITQENDALKVEYKGIKVAETGPSIKYAKQAGLTGKLLNINLSYTVRLQGDETVWEVELENNEDVGIGEIWFPIISGVTWLSPAKDDSLLIPHYYGEKINRPLETMTSKRFGMLGDIQPHITHIMYPYRMLYPGPASMQWYALCNPREGLYLGSHDKSAQTTCLNIDKEKYQGKEFLQFTFGKYPFIEKGGTWKSAPFVVCPYKGSWHIVAKKYLAWANTWMKKRTPPKWVRQMNGWQWIGLKWQSGVIQFTYDEIPRLYEDAKLGGLNTTWLVGWPHAGNDREYPEYPYNIDSRLGTEEQLKKSLAHVQAEGGNIWLYNQGRMVDPETKWYKDIGHRVVMKTIWGGEYIENWSYWSYGSLMDLSNQYKLLDACPSTPEWSNILLDYAKRSKELGTRAVFYDYWCHLRPYLCFDKTHTHKHPAMAYGPGMLAILDRVKTEMAKEDPEFAIITEGITDVAGQYVDAVQGLVKRAKQNIYDAPAEEDLRYETFPELLRYTFPELILSNRQIDAEDYASLNWAFVYGMRFDIEINFNKGTFRDAPQLATQCKRLCKIRNEYSDLLLEGTFVDTEGFSLSNEKLVAKAYKNGDKYAVLIWNPLENEQPVKVYVTDYELEKAISMEGKSSQIPPAMLGANKVLVLLYKGKE